MDAQQIIQGLPSLSMEDLQQLSDAVQKEISPSFEKLAEWESQKSDRKFEWVIHQTDDPVGCIYHAALVLFHHGAIELYKGSSIANMENMPELFAKRVALRSALRELILVSDTREDEGPDPEPVSDSDSDSDSEESLSLSQAERKYQERKQSEPKEVDKFYKLNDITTGQTSQKQESIMKRYFDGSQFSGKTHLRAAEQFFQKLTNLDVTSATYIFSLVSIETEEIFFFRGIKSIKTNRVIPHMKWVDKKNIYTDGEFVYTSLEKVYARLLQNGNLRPLTCFEMRDLKIRGIQYIRIKSIREIYALQKQQNDSEESSSESSESSSSEAEDSEDEEEHKCERIPRGSKIPCGNTAGKCLNYPDSKVMWFCGDKNGGCYKVKSNELTRILRYKKETFSSEEEKDPSDAEKPEKLGHAQWDSTYNLYTDGKFVYSGNKKIFGRLCSCGGSLCGHVKPLDISDIRTLKEAKIETVDNYHVNKIPLHVKDSRKHHEFNFSFNSDQESSYLSLVEEEEGRVYPEDDPEGCC